MMCSLPAPLEPSQGSPRPSARGGMGAGDHSCNEVGEEGNTGVGDWMGLSGRPPRRLGYRRIFWKCMKILKEIWGRTLKYCVFPMLVSMTGTRPGRNRRLSPTGLLSSWILLFRSSSPGSTRTSRWAGGRHPTPWSPVVGDRGSLPDDRWVPGLAGTNAKLPWETAESLTWYLEVTWMRYVECWLDDTKNFLNC